MASVLLDVPAMRTAVLKRLAGDIETSYQSVKGRKFNQSLLAQKEFKDLKSMGFGAIVAEFSNKFPALFNLIHSLMVPESKKADPVHEEKAMPRMAMVYSLMLFTRNQELSLVQHVMSMCLRNNLCDQKVSLCVLFNLLLSQSR